MEDVNNTMEIEYRKVLLENLLSNSDTWLEVKSPVSA